MKQVETVLTRTLEAVLAICLLAIATIVVTLVVLRYVFNTSITGANEFVTILFVYTTAIGAAVAIGRAVGLAANHLRPRVGGARRPHPRRPRPGRVARGRRGRAAGPGERGG